MSLGLDPKNIFILDSKGVVSTKRTDKVDADKTALRAGHRGARRWTTSIGGCRRVPRLVRTGGVLTPEMVKKMADRPIILAMANPEPEIRPELAKQARPDCLDRHRPLRLSEPGQQLAVLPVHLPRRARLRRDQDQRGDEARGHARARRARARRAVRHRGAGVRRGHAAVRPRLPHPARVRSAAHHQHGARGGQGGDGQRRGDASDQGLRRVSRAAVRASSTNPARRWSRCSPRPSARPSASRTRKARTSACCVRRRRRSTKGLARPVLVGRTRHHREPHPEARAAPDARRRLRRRQHPRRPALSRLLVRVLSAWPGARA